MKLLADFLPILIFFAAYKLGDIYVATGAAIAATVLQLLWLRLTGKRIEPMHWVSLAIIVVFGGATLVFQDETFIKWKPTVLYWLFAAVLAGSVLFARRNLIRTMMGGQIALPEPAWGRLNWAWAGFFAAMGALNLYVAYGFSTETWVNFKLFGSLGLTLAFVLAQAVWLSRQAQEVPLPPSADRR